MLIAYFFYFNWSQEIIHSFKSRLQSIVVATSQSIYPEDIEWISQHIHDPTLTTQTLYQSYQQRLTSLKQKLSVADMYIVQIEPVHEGEYVLPDAPGHPLNEVYEGHNPHNAYRQVMLLDASDQKQGTSSQPGEYDFSETDERQVYLTKKAFVTPIYETRKTHERFISAYAPILNKQGDVMALLGADVSMKAIDQKLKNAWLILFIGVCITLLFVILTAFLVADRISKPVQQLNQAALGIAAGDYETNIQVKGPREVVELAHTLNTMSECLVEHISRLRESSLIRERMYGEYECALLLQHYMLQKVVEEFTHPAVRLRLISVPLSPLQKGLLLKIERPATADLTLTLFEAHEQGFAGLFHLNQCVHLPKENLKDQAFIECQFLNHYTTLRTRTHHLFSPLVWSIKSQQFIKEDHQEISLHDRDMIFLYNSRVIEQFETEENIEAWLGRVLRHFAEDGLDIIHTMLTNELNFLAKKQQTKRNFQMISIQVRV
jgi:HAMP domain-containing protein